MYLNNVTSRAFIGGDAGTLPRRQQTQCSAVIASK